MSIETYVRPIVVRGSPKNSTSHKTKILFMVMNSPSGITADELEMRLKLRSSTISSALNTMVKEKMVHFSGEYRPTRSGRRAKVYVRHKRRG